MDSKELDLINQYTKRKFSADEVYTFSVVLCDNEIDRDFECFDGASLEKLAEMYIGKSGILDHNPTAENQTARIYDCKVEAVEGKLTSYGAPYKRVIAKAYMPVSEKNSDTILELDSGIKKEVSVGCSMGKSACSVCGSDFRSCSHIKGKNYGKKLCYAVLSEPRDAYEWSFVAVPAQRAAGVIKAFNGFMKGENEMNDIFKNLGSNENVVLSKDEVTELIKEIDVLKAKARDGEAYRNEIQAEVTRLYAIVEPELPIEAIKGIAEKMSIEELKAFKQVYSKKALRFGKGEPQLSKADNESLNKKNNAYMGI